MKKRVIFIMAAVLALFAATANTALAATARTQAEALDWVNSKAGTYYDQDGLYGSQCVDLVRGYYVFFGESAVSGNGKDYATNAVPTASFTRYAKDSIPGGTLQAGDIFVSTNGTYGHVGIVLSATSLSNFTSMDANYDNGNADGGNHTTVQVRTHSGYDIWGIIRPKFSGSGATPTPTPTPTPVSYTVTFKDWNGGTLKTQVVLQGGAASAPTSPSRTGYNFTGWDKSFSNITGDLTVTAQYQVKSYSVTFRDWDGRQLESQIVNHGASAAEPNTPTREGYDFTGWDKSFTNVTGDLTVNALYQKKKYTVAFTYAAGGDIISSVEVEYGQAATAPTPPTVEGSTFVRWDRAFGSVTGNMTVDAIYGKNDGVVDVSAGRYYSLILKTDGTLWATGLNSSYQLGNGTNVNKKSPVQVLSNVKSMSAGIDHSLAVRNDNSLWAWGSNNYGELGDGTTTTRYTPRQVLTDVAFAYAGADFSVAVKTDGSLWTWGLNGARQLGDGTVENRYTPQKVMEDVAMASVGYDTVAALKTSGEVYCWGKYYGNPPLIVAGDCIYVASSSGSSSTYVSVYYIRSDGSLWERRNSSSASKLRDNALSVSGSKYSYSSYEYIAQGDANAMVSHDTHRLYVKTDGSLWASGYNDYGQFGNNATSSSSSSSQIKIWPFKVTFKTLDDSLIDTQLVWRNTAATAPTPPVKPGFVFDKWESAFSSVSADIIVYAAYKEESSLPSFTVTFKNWNGTVLKSQTVKQGQAATAPTTPTREGYAFAGWDKTFSSVTANLEVTAQYTQITTPALTVGSATGAPETDILIPVTLINNPGLAGFIFDLAFDNTKLVPVEVVKGAALVGGSLTTNLGGGDIGGLTFVRAMWNDASNFTENGTLFTVKFKVKEGAEDGAVPLTLTYTPGNVTNKDYDNVTLSVTQGQISVAQFKYGNIFTGADGDDAAIDVKDAVRLAQHLAGWSTAALSPSEKKAADVYPDNVVNVKDSVKLAQYLAGWAGVVLGQL
ncbi:MAG: InlB B-repeat-containing protein [Oscillospiraceae bacterium]|jgi:surface antigen|nr:InlB B-repeat-containing protein [Oscillospiraceae bacterium]